MAKKLVRCPACGGWGTAPFLVKQRGNPKLRSSVFNSQPISYKRCMVCKGECYTEIEEPDPV